MVLKINISPGQWRNAVSKAALAGVSRSQLMGWIQEIEFDVQHSPEDKLRYIGGSDSFYERRLKQKTDKSSFVVVWEFEWDRQSDELHLLDLSPVELKS